MTEVSGKIRDAVESRLKRHGVIVDSLAAVNYDFSAVFDKAIRKWDGKLPQYTGAGTPFVQLVPPAGR